MLGVRWSGGRSLRVGEVVAVRASNEEVLTDVGQSHELVVHPAADRARVGLDDHILQAAPIEGTPIRVVHRAVGPPHPVLIRVERVSVFHQELPAPKQAETGPSLVAVLQADLVEVHRKVAVGRQFPGDERCDDLLVGGA